MTQLHQFLQSWDKPFVRGISDCCGFVAAWMAEVQGDAVICPYLGESLSDAEASDILRVPGGLRQLASHYLGVHGWRQNGGEPSDGDIVIADRGQEFHRTLLGIWSAGIIVTVSKSGLRYVRPGETSNLSTYGR